MDLFIDCMNNCRNYIKWLPQDKIRFIFKDDGYIIHEDVIRRIRFSRKTMVIEFALTNDAIAEYMIIITNESFRLMRSDIKRYLRGLFVFRSNFQLITSKPMDQITVELVSKRKEYDSIKGIDISYDPAECMAEDNEIGVVRVGYLTYT